LRDENSSEINRNGSSRGEDSKRITRAWQTTRAYELDSMAYGRDSKGFRKGLTSVWKGLNPYSPY